jgi:O-antigen biosynthesis protein WbqP
MNRLLSVIILLILLPILVFIGLEIFINDGFPIFFKQRRIGRNNREFNMYKFRTMKKDTPNLPTHLLENPEKYILPIGKFLRRLSLDELPNLINIILGQMNFVGPRPALYNQNDLIALRTKANVHTIKPGITGWAQINGRDELPIPTKVEFDTYYLKNHSFFLDIKIIFQTLFKSLRADGVVH